MITLVVLDTAGVEARLIRLADAMATGFRPAFEDIAKASADSIDRGFVQGGLPDPFKPLADATVAQRHYLFRKKGIMPVAGFTAPLRYTDELRKAATATQSGVKGSNFTQTDDSFENVLTFPFARIQDRGGTIFHPKTGHSITIPARHYARFQDNDPADFADIVTQRAADLIRTTE